jgi:small subunit ribosomal protein S6
MNHYEIVFVVDPQLDRESKLFEKCLEKIKSINGITHRSEDIGLRTLAYPINDKNTGHYFLLNFECDPINLKEIESLFKFDESIMRSSLVKKKRAETEPSILLSQTKNQKKYEDASEIDSKTDKDKSVKDKLEIDKSIDTIPKNLPKEEEQKSDNE